jgi:hypothetical protein
MIVAFRYRFRLLAELLREFDAVGAGSGRMREIEAAAQLHRRDTVSR